MTADGVGKGVERTREIHGGALETSDTESQNTLSLLCVNQNGIVNIKHISFTMKPWFDYLNFIIQFEKWTEN